MTLWIDAPTWPAHGRLWSHLVSDTSYAELHDFATTVGIPRRGFEGDHYDVPEERYPDVVAAGATPTTTRHVLTMLSATGLRLRKRKGDKGISRVHGVTLAGGAVVDVDIIGAAKPMDPSRVFAATVFLRDADGRFALTWSERRQQWGPPGGRREGDETPLATAVREVGEEVGLWLPDVGLEPVGYERFTARDPESWPYPGRDVLQSYRIQLDTGRPTLTPEFADEAPPEWVDEEGLRRRCHDVFFWPMFEWVLASWPVTPRWSVSPRRGG